MRLQVPQGDVSSPARPVPAAVTCDPLSPLQKMSAITTVTAVIDRYDRYGRYDRHIEATTPDLSRVRAARGGYGRYGRYGRVRAERRRMCLPDTARSSLPAPHHHAPIITLPSSHSHHHTSIITLPSSRFHRRAWQAPATTPLPRTTITSHAASTRMATATTFGWAAGTRASPGSNLVRSRSASSTSAMPTGWWPLDREMLHTVTCPPYRYLPLHAVNYRYMPLHVYRLAAIGAGDGGADGVSSSSGDEVMT